MYELIKKLIEIFLLKSGPQDIPHAKESVATALIGYVIAEMISNSVSADSSYIFASVILDVVVLSVFTYSCLMVMKLSSRFVQTLTALAGVSAIYHFLTVPLILILQPSTDGTQAVFMVLLLLFLLLSWLILVYVHIYRHALGVSMISSVVVSFTYLIISLSLTRMIFPELF